MRAVQFGEFHTADDWDLILNAKTMNPPNPKTVTVTVDGRDGDLDLSEALTGEVKYSRRSATFTFLLTGYTESERAETLTEIINSIHGKNLNIIEPDDPDHYLVGRCTVSDVKNTKAYASFKVTADCEPYRYATNEVNRFITASATPVDVILTNTGRKTVTPTLTVDGTVNLAFGSSNVALETGTYKLSSLLLKTGTTTVTVSGSGTVMFTYREGVL